MSLDALIHRYLEDRESLDAEELEALVAGLRGEPQRAVALREQMMLDDLLAQKLAIDRRDFLAQVRQRIADFERGEEELDAQVAELRALAEAEIDRPHAWSGSSPAVKYIVAAAALALAAAVLLAPRLVPSEPQFVAKVSAVEGDVTIEAAERSHAAAVNEALLAGHTVRVADGGAATITYDDATSVEILGPSLVVFDIDALDKAKRVRIDRGEIAAVVQRQSLGMRFTSPHAVATVVGTELRLAVSESATRLDVAAGKVRFERADGIVEVVGAHETGLASADALRVQPLTWPDDRAGLAYVYTPFNTLEPELPLMAARNPATGNLRETQLLPHGSAMILQPQMHLDLSGGHFASDEAAGDILAACAGRLELTLEVVFTPAAAEQRGATIAAFGPAEGEPNFRLVQEGGQVAFFLQAAAESEPAAIAVPLSPEGGSVHLAFRYDSGELSAFNDGAAVARKQLRPEPLSAWRPGPLTLGADGAGHNAWQGTIEGFTLYARALSPGEIARSSRHFRLLSP